ncbi:hypothetical protein AJ80_07277 [Polytolypa hystricis UAMH7299]|uniref:Vacuolar import and degradation protein 24 n=1 Tax=Polytolypa hystricis (strain UAMH7299) TaxID=1447883 RepID=A0A2B7XQ56_POLH7|nr:hypothetical protein AJ80_07277 [Polytolypa hystricis UAMH7299]
MPTPSDTPPQFSASPSAIESVSTRTTCPPETIRVNTSWRAVSGELTASDADYHAAANTADAPRTMRPQLEDQTRDARIQSVAGLGLGITNGPPSVVGKMVTDDDDTTVASLSPAASVLTDNKDELATSPSLLYPVSTPSATSSISYEYSNVRLYPNHCCSFLRAGSKFVGTQTSDRQVYNVDVEIKHVDMAESYLCGYLRIQGLTEDHPTLTTFFEGEIIGTKHTFQTRHPSWGATDKTDMKHWARFPPWRPLAKLAKKPDFTYTNFAQREHIFMRWKEYFLVPDHRVRSISGASFEGFYYICFNQFQGTVSGIYFHSKSEKYQQLELKHVENRGCFGAIEFR